jgi:hypothetical protein
VERGEHGVGVLLVDPLPGGLEVERLLEADVDGRAGLGLEDEPRLGLAVAEAEVLAGEGAARVVVDGEALAGVEELDQQGGVGAVPGDVLGAEERLGVGVDRVLEDGAEPTQSSGRPSSPSGTPRRASIRAPPL